MTRDDERDGESTHAARMAARNRADLALHLKGRSGVEIERADAVVDALVTAGFVCRVAGVVAIPEVVATVAGLLLRGA